MRKRLTLGLVTAATVVIGTVGVTAVPALAAPAGLASTIALSNCSAALVRYPSSVDTNRALMLTNGHCYEGGMPSAGQVITNRLSSRSGTLLNAAGNRLGTVRADRVLYSTMTGTDVTLYQLTDTYASIRTRYGATALTIQKTHPADGTSITIPSSYWKRIWSCKVNGFVPTLREASWTFKDSIRYNFGCNTIHGTSGSPVLDASSGNVIGINNTGNDNGGMCTLNNPCEVDANGKTTAVKGQSYGQETYWFTTCLTPANVLDLSVSGCLLPKPAR
jgi:Trypsin-like peptidase domain